MNEVYIIYEWYADADDDSTRIERVKDIVKVVDSEAKVHLYIGDKPTAMRGLYTTWYTWEKWSVK